MKLSFWYALREVRRRPGRSLSFAAILCALLISLFLLLLYMEAQWRAEVMPDNTENYHFRLYGLSEQDKAYIRALPWVQASYDIVHDAEDTPFYNPNYRNEFRVRVTWEHVMDVGECARTLMEERDIFKNAHYAAFYQSGYEYAKTKYTENRYGTAENSGDADRFSREQAEREIVSNQVLHRPFCQKTANSYLFQPDFFVLVLIFGIFSAGAVTVLLSEDYRRYQKEFGCLRALGFRQHHIFFIHASEVLLGFLCAVPVSVLFTTGALYLFRRAASAVSGETVLLTVAERIPLGLMLSLAAFLAAAAVAGVGVLCILYRDTPIMSYLREESRFSVSFVSKTSDRFEKSTGIGVYQRLYAIRARSVLLWNTAAAAFVMPLPFYMLSALYDALRGHGTPEEALHTVYTLTEASLIFLTALCITVTASRNAASARKGELGVIRALGGDKECIKKLVYADSVIQSVLLTCAALILVLVTGNLSRSVIDVNTKAESGALLRETILVLGKLCGVVLFTLPSAFAGPALFLRRFFGKSITASIRERE